jgi:hypothetical protein
MNGFEKGPLCRSLAFAVLLVTTLSGIARAAEVTVSIQYTGESQREVAERLVSELSSEGYVVEANAIEEPMPCDANGAKLVSVGTGARAWIRLGEDPAGGETVVATICYLGALPFLQQASSSAPKSDPRMLALAAVEALNGLRSKVPAHAPEEARRTPPADQPTVPVTKNPSARTEGATPQNSVTFGGAVMLNAPEFPVVPAFVTGANLGITPSAALSIDALVPVGGAELESPSVTASVRTAWLRIGPGLRWAGGDFDISGSLLAGPAVSWATAEARAPLAGTTDVTVGAVVSVKTTIEYPRRTPIFALVGASASALLPGIYVKLDESVSEPLGAFPLEASVGLGARWGGGF